MTEPNPKPKLALVRSACPCGWKPPKNLRLEVLGLATVVELTYECPECGATCRPAGMSHRFVQKSEP